ncbi:mucin-associated surface protein [Trypanosoma cruzi cruzi]|uniref:Mucin-associated surface protein (MASP) n=1 Tax=Trypanosoma cruzi TaxID=5693 RepID=A0A2V2W5I4_TRYCR|nr:mucin-associated surface protein [Trypanosoma cruzi cruzi]PWV03367.1 Mucin-associated surface protein (MASP) [Trypanosoma cruzi]
MAMMMTGRVLLVCALCVLWCGTPGAAADGSEMTDLSGIGGGSLPESKEIGKSPERPQVKKDETGDVKGKKPLASSGDNEEDDADGVEKDYDVVVDDLEEEEREEEAVDPAETEIPSGQRKEEASSAPQSKHEKRPTAAAEGIPTAQSPATAVQPTTQGQPPKAAPSPEDSPVPAASTATVTPAVASSEQGNIAAPARKKDEKQSEDIYPAQESEQPGPQDVVLVQHSQGVHESKESNNNPRNPASASATANQRDATFNGHGEPAQATSSNKRVFESNDANSGTEEGITSDDPTADGAGTNDTKNSQNMHGNTKETPVEATAMKGATATTGDSDSSTAVTYFTSPLLLLLFVACAAAAAVVAA